MRVTLSEFDGRQTDRQNLGRLLLLRIAIDILVEDWVVDCPQDERTAAVILRRR